jgi:RNA polymerase-interacting CarD/CdnL/TRCF family regulator
MEVGATVAYPPHGVGRIVGRETRIVHGVDEEVVVIDFGNDLLVTLPLSRARSLLRPPLSEADLGLVQKTLGEDVVPSDDTWPKRMSDAQAKLRKGDPLELAEIIRDAVRRERRVTPSGAPTKLSTSERALYLKARESLASEISVVRLIGTDEASAWIDAQLAAGDS